MFEKYLEKLDWKILVILLAFVGGVLLVTTLFSFISENGELQTVQNNPDSGTIPVTPLAIARTKQFLHPDFSLNYPEDWTVAKRRNTFGDAFVISNPSFELEGERYPSFFVQTFPSNNSQNSITMIEFLRGMNFQKTECRFKKIICTQFTRTVEYKGRQLTTEAIVVQALGKVYYISYEHLASESKTIDDEIFAEIIASLQLPQ